MPISSQYFDIPFVHLHYPKNQQIRTEILIHTTLSPGHVPTCWPLPLKPGLPLCKSSLEISNRLSKSHPPTPWPMMQHQRDDGELHRQGSSLLTLSPGKSMGGSTTFCLLATSNLVLDILVRSTACCPRPWPAWSLAIALYSWEVLPTKIKSVLILII